MEAAADVIVARHISTYPVATQDGALVVAAEVAADEVLAALRDYGIPNEAPADAPAPDKPAQ